MELRIYKGEPARKPVAYLRLIKMMDESVQLTVVDHNGQIVSGGPIVTIGTNGKVTTHRDFV